MISVSSPVPLTFHLADRSSVTGWGFSWMRFMSSYMLFLWDWSETPRSRVCDLGP